MKIEIQDSEINVEEIMKQIRENIRNRKYDGEVDMNQLGNLNSVNSPSQNNSSMDSLLNEQTILNRIWSYSADYLITSHRKWIGKFIVFGKKVIRKCLRWYINPVVDKQVQFNATVVRAINQLVELIRQHADTINDYKRLEQLEIQLKQLEETIRSIKNDISDISTEIYAVRDEMKNIYSELKALASSHKEELNHLQISANLAGSRLRRLERSLKGRIQQEAHQIVVNDAPEEPLDFDYFLFEEYFRGSREHIMEIQRRYLRYFSEGQFVLDLGCGRGEFLELLTNHGVRAVGVDMNDDMIAFCRERGLTVYKADLMEYLGNLKDNSVDGIFLSHVIEHLQPRQLIRLIQLAYAKLKPNGYFIAETPNPRSLSIFAQSFYMDMTHTRPVHPFTAKFLLETEGFHNIEIHYFSPNDDTYKWQELKLDGADPDVLNRFNKTMEKWHQFIFGEQDYCIVGRK